LVFRSIVVAAALALSLGLAGCRQDMQDQPKFVPLRSTTFFADGRSARTQLAGTVARGQNNTDDYFLTGMTSGKEGDALPFPATVSLLQRGQERFNIYCSPCHSRVGNGAGRIVERGYYPAADFQSERLRQAPLGHFFNVITHGFGAMPDYHVELAPADRWAVVAYIRALQLSQSAKTSDAPNGTGIANLAQVAEQQGLPLSFADADWTSKAKPLLPSVSAATPARPGATGATNEVIGPDSARQGGGITPNPEQTASSNDQQPAAAAAPAGNPAAGKQLYIDNCLVCHQANRQGLPPVFPALVDIVAKVGEPKVRQVVTNGIPTAKPPMPSFASKFSAADLDNLISFLKTKP
jgi:mono/diheme cytochrome c family protein